MPERRFLPTPLLAGYALYQIPYHCQFAIECRSCGVLKDMPREDLNQVSKDMSLKELSPRFRCTLCGEKNATIMAGDWANGAPER
ncbi:hypothetical protein [Rhizobium halophilum]|uniref:hypothetical protein n=1 Tax=Rhizobium halophilum TaxID=2846852 RepID=UPI001EFC81AA|nr:hypothetical protein [Rhizobium halophilum]MCF6370708.1 hypothetical protein [Rhizobium halophilum]